MGSDEPATGVGSSQAVPLSIFRNNTDNNH